MEKKLFIMVMAMTLLSSVSSISADDNLSPLPLCINHVPGDHNTSGGNAHPKSPVQIPEVYLDGNTLSFDAAIEGCEVRLLDEDENVIFSDFIAISQTSLILPATLTGTFELQIIRGNFIFYCEIEL